MTRHRFSAAWRPVLLSLLILPLLAGHLSAATLQQVPSRETAPKPLIVRNDPGGSVLKRFIQMSELRMSGTRVEIRGTCNSACTFYLGLKDTCLTPKATLGFHGLVKLGGGKYIPEDAEKLTEIIAQNYNEPLRRWYLETARHSKELLRIKGAELIRLGYKQC